MSEIFIDGGDGDAADAARRVGQRLTRHGHRALVLPGEPALRDRALAAIAADGTEPVTLLAVRVRPPAPRWLAAPDAVWIHERAPGPSVRFGRALAAELGGSEQSSNVHLRRGRFPLLDPERYRPGMAACLAQLGFSPSPSSPSSLVRYGDRPRGELIDRLADATHVALSAPGGVLVRRDEQRIAFDVWHEVPLVPQLTGMSCWAAAAAMIIGWRDRIDVEPEAVARASGRWSDFRDGLRPRDVATLARCFGLVMEPLPTVTAETLRRLLEQKGPLWVGDASPGLHVVVLAGIVGDGTPDGSHVRVVDPWPAGKGERYTITLRELSGSLAAAADLSGFGCRALVLHANGRGPRSAASRSVSVRERSSTTIFRR